MRVVVFDIDGTLTATTDVDGRCYAAAVRAVLEMPSEISWSDVREFTDAAILRQLCGTFSERDPRVVEAEVQSLFFEYLDAALASEPQSFLAVPGASSVFAGVREAGWVPSIATGGWRRSAELKLRAARIPLSGIPIATSSDHPRRLDIIRLAVGLASGEHKPPDVDVVYVGDGLWDVRAARELGIGFIGRASPDATERLRAGGATAVIPDFTRLETLLDLLEDPSAVVPSDEPPSPATGVSLQERL